MPIKVSEDLVLYDVEELAKLFGMTEKSIRLLFREGKLQGRKMARKWYTTEAELKAYFARPETVSQSAKADALKTEEAISGR